MPFIETPLTNLLVFEPRVFADSRGYFFESYSTNAFLESGLDIQFVQDNESKSTRGVLRGLHYQINPHAQAKLVRVVVGEVMDVVVDIRVGSPTFGKSYSVLLSGENKKQLFIPRGFAHGFAVLSAEAIFQYKCDNFYNRESEGGILFSDAELNIDWGMDITNAIVSDKDKVLPSFRDCKNNFVF